MIRPPIQPDEDRRLAALRRLALLDTEPNKAFDRITRIARRVFDLPFAFVTLLDEDQQWITSRLGGGVEGTPRNISFAAHAVAANEVLVVEDVRLDERFYDNPLVTEAVHVVFYAGAPIRSPDGFAVGALVLVGTEPRTFDPADIRTLEDLAAVVEREIALHHRACLDEVTGVYNRRGFVAVGRSALARAASRREPAILAYLDVDGLKALNDARGHGAGDHALLVVAHALRALTRASDVVGRLGGDEFGILLLDCTRAACETILENLEGRFIAELSAVAPGLDVGLSSGTADATPGSSLDDLIEIADAEMYARKVAKHRI